MKGDEMRPDTAATGSPGAERLKRVAAVTSVTVAGILIAVKIGAWLATGSVSLLSTLIDSMLDLAASVINLLAIRHALQPPDREHRFGHGKAEPLAGLAQAAFVGGSAAFLLFHAVERLITPVPIANSAVGIAVMLFSIAMTLGLVAFQRFVVRRTGSVAIRADSLHYSADLLVNACVVLALVLTVQFGWTAADPLFAIGIAVFILHGAWGILQSSLNLLMDRELPEDDRRRIRDIAISHAGVISLHDLRTRSSGTRIFIQMHLEMEADLTLAEAHRIGDDVMEEVENAFPDAEVLIHQDPFGIDERRARFD
ncbi:MAG: cation diffusion facilitator family transporter [Rhodospirillales bacterium]